MARRILKAVLAAAVGYAGISATVASSQELPRVHLKVVGTVSTANQHKLQEKPFFLERLPERSHGQITAELTAEDNMGLKGDDTLRLLSMGVLQIAKGTITKLAGDDVSLEGIDLAGLTSDLDTARKTVEAYKPFIAEQLAKHNVKLLSVAPVTMQVLFCKPKIERLADLAGKKIRVFNAAMAQFVEALGASSSSIPFVETVPALQRGVIDCGVTGTSNGNTTRWWEVTHYLYTLPLGWSIYFHAANLEFWNGLDPRVQDFLTEEFAYFEDSSWEQARTDLMDGIYCNTGTGPCEQGIEADPPMTLVELNPEDEATRLKILQDVVVPRWAEACGADCTRAWNDTIGNVLGISIPVN